MILKAYLIATFAFGAIVELNKNQKVKELYLKAVFLTAFIIAGLRGISVGRDTASYFSIFNRISEFGITELPRSTELEKGYMILCWLLSKISDSPQILLVVSSGIISYSFYIIIKKYSDNYLLSSLIFIATIFTVTMNVTRQYIALGFIFLAFINIIDKNKRRALVFMALAISMHYSAILFLPIMIFSFEKINLTKRRLVVMGFGMILIIPLFSALLDLIVSLFPQYNRFLGSERYSMTSEISTQMILYMAVIMVCIVIGMKIQHNAENPEDSSEKLLVKEDTQYYLFVFLFIGYVVSYVVSTKMLMAYRMVYYFQASQVIVIPNMINRLSNTKLEKSNRILSAVFVAYFIYTGINYIRVDPHDVLPYTFFWE